MDFFHTISRSDLGVFALGLVIAGAVSGIAAGVLGVGGGIVIVPVLYHVMAALGIDPVVRMHVAVGTSFAALVPVALMRAGNVGFQIDHRVYWPWSVAVATFAGLGVLGAWALGNLSPWFTSGHVLEIIFAMVAFGITLRLLSSRRQSDCTRNAPLALPIAGFVSGLTGIDTAALGDLFGWVLRESPPVSRQVARLVAQTALIVAVVASVVFGRTASNLPPYSVGYVNFVGFALIAPVLLVAEPAGAAVAHMMDLRRLRLVFAGLIVITTARMLWDAFT